ncbi:MAG: DcrB-related protein [Desulfovibrionaceae bacterium]
MREMMKKRSWMLLLGGMLLLVAACSGGLPEGFKEYKDLEQGFSIGYPEDWKELHGMGTLVTFAHPDENAKGRPNFGVTTEALKVAVTPDEYLENAKSVMVKVMPGFEFLEQTSETINGENGVRFKYDIEVDGQKLTLLGFAVIKNNTAYVVTGGCKQEQFEENVGTFDKAGRSLRIL